tara:strand:- start:616 stop:1566 length:951 start_codon:yes stop_codon:yes gene_type:complete
MSVYKPLLASDILVTPLEVSKGRQYNSTAELTSGGIDIFLGTQESDLFSTANLITGNISTYYQRLIFDGVKELYYSNYQSSSYGDPVSIPINVPFEQQSGESTSAGRYENYLQTDLTYERYFPTGSGSQVAVYSIPKKLYGEKIQPNSFKIVDAIRNLCVVDDGEGNLIANTTPTSIVGNIIYQHGVAVITKAESEGTIGIVESFAGSGFVSCSFSSSYTVYETQYKCTVNPSEYNFSLNETLLNRLQFSSAFSTPYNAENTSDGVNFATDSNFNPYITGIGLYNDNKELLAIAKLAKPLPTSTTTDTTILINIDR